MLNFKEGVRIPLTQRHIMLGDRQSQIYNAVALALREATGDEQITAIVFPLHECVGFYRQTDQANGKRKDVGELMTTTTFEDWYCEYMDTGKIQPSEMYIFKQDDSEFLDEDYEGDDRLWIGVDSDPKPSHKTLVRVVNNQTCKEVETLLLCDKHLNKVNEMYSDQATHKNLITVARHLTGICEMCCGKNGDTTPITYHPVADSITAHVVFLDGTTATWEGHGGVGSIDYLRANDGGIYTTMQALKDCGVRCFTLENMHEVEVD